MDLRPLLAQATRFFARPVTFDCECPHCGEVYVIRWRGARAARNRPDREKHTQADPNWDPLTARFQCTACQREYVVGLLFWPIRPAPHVASQPPRDQVPSPRQLAGLRKEGGGWWLPDELAQRYPRPDTTNLAIEEERPDDADDELDT